MVNKPRVRQLVAKVHTTPLNGRAPNASALRSDYRYTSSPPDKEQQVVNQPLSRHSHATAT